MNRLGVAMMLGALCGALALPASAADEAKDIVLVGDAKCTKCHDEADDPKVLAIGKTRHGVTADIRNPTCTSCHGTSEEHIAKAGRGGEPAPKVEVGYTSRNPATVEQRNAKCLTCHQGGARTLWHTGPHATRDVACTNCHKVHDGHDKVRDRAQQAEVCFACHKEQRAQINRQSHHPVLEGKVACSDCHNSHGSAGPKLMVRDSVNATCYTCHMEKRGPLVRTHQPVTEDCSICHNPHGSNIDNLLKARSPFLCQQCHEPTSHRGNTASLTFPAGSTSNVTLARGCLNCHTQIHGSNNPVNAGNERTFRR
jgi:DmsE family decaheme c-type cytochrome